MIRRIAAFVLAAVIFVPVGAHAIDIRRVVSDKGIVAWFVPDKSVPVVALSFAFRNAGAATDPAGKEGIAEMVTGLLDEGAGDLASQDYQRAVEEIAAQISFDAGRDHFFGRLRTLSAERDRAFQLMRVAINAPRFDAKTVERVRGQILAGLQQQAESP
ncbi:MAG: insulinase family protein, partial [Alphaproteobacteria bacterium]